MQKALNGQIEALVDSLRRKGDTAISLAEVAGVTEVLIKSMQLYFRSIDVRIYEECQALSEYIANSRREIAALQPKNLEGARIPRAGKELDAIARQTEEATHTIMEAAEEIMAIEADDLESYRPQVESAILRIFEACSFQDITGQRISKVVETLKFIEQRALALKNILGVDPDRDAPPPEPEEDEDRALLRGPALDGEGIDQAQVDALLADGAAPKKTPAVKPAAKAAPASKDAPAKPATAARNAAAEKKAKAPEVVGGKGNRRGSVTSGEIDALEPPANSDRTTQSEIDALFS